MWIKYVFAMDVIVTITGKGHFVTKGNTDSGKWK